MTTVRRALAALAIAMAAGVACDGEGGTSPLLIDFYKEEVVIPSGSTIATRYWVYIPLTLQWHQVSESSMPEDSKVTTITTTVGAAPSVGITGASVVADNTAIVALFAGGRGPGNAIASDRAALYDATGTLVTGLHMTAARLEHAMAPLSGQRVLITGGFGPDEPTVVLNSAEVFSLASKSFVPTGAMHVRRSYHTATTLADGRVLVAGGSVPTQGTGPTTGPSATTEFYDPASGTFSDGPSMVTARAEHSAITLNDGRVLVLGGIVSRNAEVYTPSTNTFTPVGQMSAVHAYGHIAVKLASGKVLVAGGDASANVQPSAAAEIFDPATNTFTPIGNMLSARMLHAAVLLDDGRVHISGGRGPGGGALSSTEIFDPATNAFTNGPAMPGESYGHAGAFVAGQRPSQ